MTDAIDHPPHYNAHPAGVECIELVERLPFCHGNAIKYLWRADHKGSRLEDLKKAAWYVDRAMRSDEALLNDTFACDFGDLVRLACTGFDDRVGEIISFVAHDDLADAAALLALLIIDAEKAPA